MEGMCGEICVRWLCFFAEGISGASRPMIQLLLLKHRLAGHIRPHLAEQLVVGVGEDDGGVHLAPAEIDQLVHRKGGVLVGYSADGEREQELVGVHAGVVTAQMLHLEVLDGLNDRRGDEIDLVGDAREVFEGIEECRRGRAEELGGLARDHVPVGELDGHGGASGALGYGAGGAHHGAVGLVEPRLVHEELDLLHLGELGLAATARDGGLVVAADDLLRGGGPDGLVVVDGVARLVDPHVGGALVGALAEDAGHHGLQHAEDLDVAVVVDRDLTVGLEVVGVDDVDIREVGGGRLVGEVDGVLERQVPDGEGLELGVSRRDPPLVLVVELGEAGRHLARPGAGGGDDDQRAAGLDEFIAAKALVADHMGDVGGVIGDGVVAVDPDAALLQRFFEDIGGVLAGVAVEHHAPHIQAHRAEGINEAEHLAVVGDAEVTAVLVGLDVGG